VRAESESLLAFGSHRDLVVGISDVDFCEAVSSAEPLHQLLWPRHGMMVRLQLRIHHSGIVAARLDPRSVVTE